LRLRTSGRPKVAGIQPLKVRVRDRLSNECAWHLLLQRVWQFSRIAIWKRGKLEWSSRSACAASRNRSQKLSCTAPRRNFVELRRQYLLISAKDIVAGRILHGLRRSLARRQARATPNP